MAAFTLNVAQISDTVLGFRTASLNPESMSSSLIVMIVSGSIVVCWGIVAMLSGSAVPYLDASTTPPPAVLGAYACAISFLFVFY